MFHIYSCFFLIFIIYRIYFYSFYGQPLEYGNIPLYAPQWLRDVKMTIIDFYLLTIPVSLMNLLILVIILLKRIKVNNTILLINILMILLYVFFYLTNDV